jgi:hypothetical protein
MVADDVRFNEAEFIVNVSGDCREQVGRVHITEFRARVDRHPNNLAARGQRCR